LLDPDPQTVPLALACTNNVLPEPRLLEWVLTVNPGPILGGAPFGAELEGELTINEGLLFQTFSVTGRGYKRLNVLDARATVHVRGGVTASAPEDLDVLLTTEFIPASCTYDADGEIGMGAGSSFPSCSLDKNGVDGANIDCTGLGGEPNSEDPCGQFVELPTEADCERCAEVYDRGAQCNDLGICLTGDLVIPLVSREERPAGYLAAGSGSVLFGWDDQVPLEVGPVDFDAEPGPIGLRVLLGGVYELALECTMIASGSAPSQREPAPASDLIAFDIQTF
jgi:hypothetical protein